MPSMHLFGRQQPVKTGQTIVYVAGDDGTHQKGYGAGTRWVVNGDGTVTDLWNSRKWVLSPARMILGTPGAVTSDNMTHVAKGNWLNNRAYGKGNLVSDPVGGSRYICLVDHTSRPDAPQFAAETLYAIDAIVRESPTGNYYKCKAEHTSLADFDAWANESEYTTGDIVKGWGSHYYKALQSHTSPAAAAELTQSGTYAAFSVVQDPNSGNYYAVTNEIYGYSGPSSWSAYNYYYPGNYCEYGGQYFQCWVDHAASGSFNDDWNNGYWGQIDYATFLVAYGYLAGPHYYEIEAANAAYYAENASDVWTDLGANLLAVERSLSPTYWSYTTTTYSMSYDRSQHPTYWVKSDIAGDASNLNAQVTQSFDSVMAYLAAVNAAGYAGRTDWRIANINELLTLFDPARDSPPFIAPPFVSYFSVDIVWSSTTPRNSTTNCICVQFAYQPYATTPQPRTFAHVIMLVCDV